VASLHGESGGRTNAIGDSCTAYGLGQWHPDRQALFKAWAGHDIRLSTGDEQLGFVMHELGGTEKSAGDKLNAAKGAYTSGEAISRYYERPGIDQAAKDRAAALRGNYAASLYGIPGASSSVGDASGGGRSTSSTTSVHIAELNVHTQATDAPGIANSIGDALGDWLLTSQANSGLAH